MEPTGCKTITSTKVAAEAISFAEACSKLEDPFHQHSRTQPAAKPDLPHTTECDLPGPQSQDDDEDSSPIAQDSDLADHVPCSNYDMTSSGHDIMTLTLLPGASAHGSQITKVANAKLTDCDRKVAPALPRTTEECAKLTHV